MFGRATITLGIGPHSSYVFIEKVCNESRMASARYLLDLIEIRDTFRHSGSLLSFNEVCCLQCFDTVGWAAGRASGL